MDFLLDPNVAYLFLLGGVLFAMLALITPGTGLLELLAFFSLTLAGYAIYNLSVSGWAIGVMLLSVAVFIYSIQKPKREIFLGVAILLLVIGSVFIFPSEDGLGMAVNPLVAGIFSSFVAGFLWIAARKGIEAAHTTPLHDLAMLVGQVGEARTNIHTDGSVQVGKQLWSARSDVPIPLGSQVRVVARDGFVVVVEQVKK